MNREIIPSDLSIEDALCEKCPMLILFRGRTDSLGAPEEPDYYVCEYGGPSDERCRFHTTYESILEHLEGIMDLLNWAEEMKRNG